MIEVRCQCGKTLRLPESQIGHGRQCRVCDSGVRLVAPNYTPDGPGFGDRLIVAVGPSLVGQQFMLGGPGPIEIGKLPERDIFLPGNKVSRGHARLTRVEDGWRIEDTGSRNGVHVNGEPVHKRTLVPGDRVKIGDFMLDYAVEAKPGADEGSEPALELDLGLEELAEDSTRAEAVPVQRTRSIADEIDDEDKAWVDADALYRIGPPPPPPAPPELEKPKGPALTCPACEKTMDPGVKICVTCGIDLRTGKTIVTTSDQNLDEIYETTESILRVISWIFPWGFFPIASEALGLRRPYVTWAIAVVTLLISLSVTIATFKDPTRLRTIKQYMLWSGSRPMTAREIHDRYARTDYGDWNKYEMFLEDNKDFVKKHNGPETEDEIARYTLRKLPLGDRCIGQYEPHQLVTHMFLHNGVLHVLGNLIFLLVIGGRVNAMIGNLATLLLYPLLGIAAAAVYMWSRGDQAPIAMVGASGAIMGLTGVYLALAPTASVHMMGWWRHGWWWGFQLRYRVYPWRGFWVVLLYLSFDLVGLLLGITDGTARWAHVGGLGTGVVVGLLLVTTRLVNARGGDLLSVMLGRRAWKLVGKPDVTRPSPIAVF